MSLVRQIAVTPQVFGHQLKGEMQSLRASECIQWGRCEHPREEKQPCCRALLGGDTPVRGQEDALPYLGMWKGEAQFKPFKARSRFLFKFQIEIVVDPRSVM